MIWTTLCGLKSTLINMYLLRHWPLITNLRWEYQENHSKSDIVERGGNMKNDYVAQSARRYDFNILEAIKETLATMNIQVAAWITLSICLKKVRGYVNLTFDVEVTNKMFALKDGDFTEFRKSAVFTSLMAGIVSLTFAQWKQYMTRHQKDSSMIGKLVFFLACFFNSLAIVVTQTTFYIVGFLYFTGILLVILRKISGFDEYDAITKPTAEVTIVLVLVIVLVPLKFIPKMFDYLVKVATDKWILRKNYHLNKRNRTGYDITGVVHSMFLPGSFNNYDHIADDELTVNPGCSYFSKDITSKQLYRLKFGIQIFHKVLLHVLYLICTSGLLNTVHIVLEAGTIEVNPSWLGLLDIYHFKSAIMCACGIIPTLIVSFGLLYIYYNHCHPWVSEGISVGFDPLANQEESQGDSHGKSYSISYRLLQLK